MFWSCRNIRLMLEAMDLLLKYVLRQRYRLYSNLICYRSPRLRSLSGIEIFSSSARVIRSPKYFFPVGRKYDERPLCLAMCWRIRGINLGCGKTYAREYFWFRLKTLQSVGYRGSHIGELLTKHLPGKMPIWHFLYQKKTDRVT